MKIDIKYLIFAYAISFLSPEFLFHFLRWLKPLFSYGRKHNVELKDLYNVTLRDVSETLGNRLERWVYKF